MVGEPVAPQIPDAVTQGVQRVVTQGSESILSTLTNAPMRIIGGLFSGIFSFSSILSSGALFGLASWQPELVRGTVKHLTDWLRTTSWGASWADRVDGFINHLTDTSVPIGERIGYSALLGGGLGGLFGAISNVFGGGQQPAPTPQQDDSGGIGSIISNVVIWGAVAAVGIGAVNYITSHGDASSPGSPPPPTPNRPPVLPQGVTQ